MVYHCVWVALANDVILPPVCLRRPHMNNCRFVPRYKVQAAVSPPTQ